MTDLLIGFLFGAMIGWIVRGSKSAPVKEDSKEILVRRVRPSFRNPGMTSTVSYDSYKTSKGLYAPTKPGRGKLNDEVEKT